MIGLVDDKGDPELVDDRLVGLVRSRIDSIVPSVVELRHNLHSSPEVGLETTRTAGVIRDFLSKTTLQFRQPLLGADVIGELASGRGRMLALRADMDAVPIEESAQVPYRSKTAGAMHACGHDGHAAILAGTALVLDALREHLQVNVRFIFQPGEEMICAGRTLVERGACDGCETVYALHGWPGLPEACVSTRSGALFAAGAHFSAVIKGKGCHAATPEAGSNPIPVAAAVVSQLQRLHDELLKRSGSVVSVCEVHAGSASNIIPDTANMGGTTRYVQAEEGDRIENAVRRAIVETSEAAGMTVEITYDRSYDLPVLNTAGGCGAVRRIAEQYLPTGAWREADRPTMAMEDFAYYLNGREGAMFLLGLGEDYPKLHTPQFDFNDRVTATGILMYCLLAMSYTSP